MRAWQSGEVHDCCRPVVLGHPEVLQRAIDLVGVEAEVHELDTLTTMQQLGVDMGNPERIVCLPVGDDELLNVPPGVVDARTGEAAYQTVVRGIRGALAGQFEALVTGPISKAALHAAGHRYPGHTELLAELCGVDDFAMMLYLPQAALPDSRAGLGVVHVTLHCAMRAVPEQLSVERIAQKCHLAATVVRDGFGIDTPRIAVAALNPHAGESGLFGTEEQEVIEPAVARAVAEGVDAVGPLPADTLMIRASEGEFDAVVAMYHDQGHIALKLLAMHHAVNVTLGLPIIRTSVAHGTAFDRAWQGRAESTGMVAAIKTAATLAERRFRYAAV